jgi:hypothetical protein
MRVTGPQDGDPDQRIFDFNPIEAKPEESERQRREIARWTREEAKEDFYQLPGETMSEFYAAREEYLQELDTFGPLFPRPPCAAWQMVRERSRPPPARAPRQLTLALKFQRLNP